MLIEEIRLADDKGNPTSQIMGIARLASTQGGERYNAHIKVMYPLISSGRPGSETQYFETVYASKLALASGEYKMKQDRAIKKNQRARWLVDKEDDDDDDESAARGGGGGGNGEGDSAVPLKAKRVRGLRQKTRVEFSCACGRPAQNETFTALELDVECASAVRLERGNTCCVTCHSVAQLMCEVCVDTPTGLSAGILKLAEMVRAKTNAQRDFDVQADALRTRRQEEEARARASAPASQLDVMIEETEPPPSGPSASSAEGNVDSSDDEAGALVL